MTTHAATEGDRIARADRLAALSFGARAAIVAALLWCVVVGIERIVLAHPAELAAQIPGLPSDRLYQLRGAGGRTVLMGDSVVQSVAADEPDQRNLGTMLEAELGLGVLLQAQAASGSELHRAWLHYLASVPVLPTAAVVAVNPRSFSAHWDRNPGWLFHEQAMVIDHPIFGRCASVLEWDWERPTGEEHLASEVIVSGRVVGTLASIEHLEAGWDPPEEIARGRYLSRYACDYARSRHVHDLEALVDEANACPFPVVLYLTPIDVDAIRAHVDAASFAAVEQNLAFLRARLRRSRWPTLDATELVRAADFDHPVGDPHEHLRAEGRWSLVHAIGGALRAAGRSSPDAGVGH